MKYFCSLLRKLSKATHHLKAYILPNIYFLEQGFALHFPGRNFKIMRPGGHLSVTSKAIAPMVPGGCRRDKIGLKFF